MKKLILNLSAWLFLGLSAKDLWAPRVTDVCRHELGGSFENLRGADLNNFVRSNRRILGLAAECIIDCPDTINGLSINCSVYA